MKQIIMLLSILFFSGCVKDINLPKLKLIKKSPKVKIRTKNNCICGNEINRISWLIKELRKREEFYRSEIIKYNKFISKIKE